MPCCLPRAIARGFHRARLSQNFGAVGRSVCLQGKWVFAAAFKRFSTKLVRAAHSFTSRHTIRRWRFGCASCVHLQTTQWSASRVSAASRRSRPSRSPPRWRCTTRRQKSQSSLLHHRSEAAPPFACSLFVLHCFLLLVIIFILLLLFFVAVCVFRAMCARERDRPAVCMQGATQCQVRSPQSGDRLPARAAAAAGQSRGGRDRAGTTTTPAPAPTPTALPPATPPPPCCCVCGPLGTGQGGCGPRDRAQRRSDTPLAICPRETASRGGRSRRNAPLFVVVVVVSIAAEEEAAEGRQWRRRGDAIIVGLGGRRHRPWRPL